MPLLSPDDTAVRLSRLAGWQLVDHAIQKQFMFETFLDGVRFVDRVATLAEAFDHHPDIDIRYKRITMTLSTHSAGGITEKDFALAEQIDKVVRR
ncbi:MAG: 4a-hydroxytetrahydrobiopterin dehydratase [Nitrospirota bacterium]